MHVKPGLVIVCIKISGDLICCAFIISAFEFQMQHVGYALFAGADLLILKFICMLQGCLV